MPSPIRANQAGPHDLDLLDPPRQGPAHRVALERRHQLDAVLLAPGRGLFSMAFDPRGAFAQQIAGGVLCVATMFASRQRAQPGLGTRNSPPGDGCAAHGPELGCAALPRQGDGQLHLRHHRSDRSRAVFLVMYNLHVGAGVAAHAGPAAGNLGARAQRRRFSPRSPFAAATANCCCR